jgi:hypothetical protein
MGKAETLAEMLPGEETYPRRTDGYDAFRSRRLLISATAVVRSRP